MTKRIGSVATAKTAVCLRGPKGVNAALAALTGGDRDLASLLEAAQVRTQNAAADLAERSGGTQYPTLDIYCEKVVNSLKEKFRRFSGSLQMAIEIRHSQDRLEGTEEKLELYADAAAQSLDTARGDWGDGMFYAGGYEIAFSGVKRGGKNYVQSAKITFEIEVSRN
ncbi:MAG: hypothetical protein LAQ30_06400 [Acidobacteriia bacterium]|nr:hypothetical protein [Terriglobia bacterium]